MSRKVFWDALGRRDREVWRAKDPEDVLASNPLFIALLLGRPVKDTDEFVIWGRATRKAGDGLVWE